jgi:hypothetical protein
MLIKFENPNQRGIRAHTNLDYITIVAFFFYKSRPFTKPKCDNQKKSTIADLY